MQKDIAAHIDALPQSDKHWHSPTGLISHLLPLPQHTVANTNEDYLRHNFHSQHGDMR